MHHRSHGLSVNFDLRPEGLRRPQSAICDLRRRIPVLESPQKTCHCGLTFSAEKKAILGERSMQGIDRRSGELMIQFEGVAQLATQRVRDSGADMTRGTRS